MLGQVALQLMKRGRGDHQQGGLPGGEDGGEFACTFTTSFIMQGCSKTRLFKVFDFKK